MTSLYINVRLAYMSNPLLTDERNPYAISNSCYMDFGEHASTCCSVRSYHGNGDELPNGVSLVSRYHSPSTKQTFMVADVDKVEAMNEWLLKYSDLGDFSVHPIVTDENIGPAVEQILAWGA